MNPGRGRRVLKEGRGFVVLRFYNLPNVIDWLVTWRLVESKSERTRTEIPLV
jgi:hypothetical protein